MPRVRFADLSILPELALKRGVAAGVDEVGRGALFGPVAAGAVVLPPLAFPVLAAAGVTDSKLLSPERRTELATLIRQHALAWAVGAASPTEIDRHNILNATLLAMRRAVQKLNVRPSLCLIDGKNTIPELPIRQQAIIKGDRTSLVIAAASIVAKVWRDRLIDRLARRFPDFDLESNKGYGTEAHCDAIRRLGPTPLHRKTFAPCRPEAGASRGES